MRKYYFLILIIGTQLAHGQRILYSHAFTETIEEHKLSFAKPIEGLFKPKMLPADELLSYDLVIESKDVNTELRFWVDPKPMLGPDMYCYLRASHMAVNDDTFDIRIQQIPPEDLDELFHADWGASIFFVPKASLTDHYYAKWICLYKEGAPILNTLILFDDHTIDPNRFRGLLHYRPSEDNPPDK